MLTFHDKAVLASVVIVDIVTIGRADEKERQMDREGERQGDKEKKINQAQHKPSMTKPCQQV